MRYFLGVDGGGSKTIAIVIDENGKIRGMSRSKSIDILNVTEDEAKNNLDLAVKNALKSAHLKIENISSSCFGVPIVDDVKGVTERVKPLIDDLNVRHYSLVNDVRVALEGAHPLRSGAIVLAGTGAMVMAKDTNDRIYRIDGWGEHVGDMGSGYYIGQKLLQTAFKEYDGRLERTPLLRNVMEYANVSDLREIILRCKGTNVRSYIANFSYLACASAREGDKLAQKILDKAVEELVQSTKTMGSLLKDEKPLLVAKAGGVFECEYIKREFESQVSALEYLKPVKETFLPHVGAVIMAAKEIMNPDEIKLFCDKLKEQDGSDHR